MNIYSGDWFENLIFVLNDNYNKVCKNNKVYVNLLLAAAGGHCSDAHVNSLSERRMKNTANTNNAKMRIDTDSNVYGMYQFFDIFDTTLQSMP